MIVRYESDHLVLFCQDDHGQVSGQMAAYWGNGDFLPVEEPYRSSVVTAASMHDCGWREADQVVQFRDDGRPYDFVTYPLEARLDVYQRGVNMVEATDPYAAVLCSLHYTGFVQEMRGLTGRLSLLVSRYLSVESQRRRRLTERLADTLTPAHILPDGRFDERTMHHFALLRLWDLLSLLLCMTRPGSPPETWGAWFGRGEIRMPTSVGQYRTVTLRWDGEERLLLTPFPFSRPLDICIPYRQLPAGVMSKPPQPPVFMEHFPPQRLFVRLDGG